jgi:DNA polymerase III alpha subunit
VKTNQYGQVELAETQAFDALYNKTITNLNGIYIDHPNQYNTAVKTNADSMDLLYSLPEQTVSIQEFDQSLQKQWFIPDEYKNFEIVGFLLDQTTNETEYQRVVEELELFYQHNMVDLLIYLKYLVDTMKDNNIVWGVGRGSSVASYCLYLLNVHRIDSIKYNLDIKEFFR